MKNLKRCLFILVALLSLVASSTTNAQSPVTDRLKWDLDEAEDVVGSRTMKYEGVLRIYPRSRVVWSQRNGTKTSEYAITGIEGSWADIKNIGTLTYVLSHNDQTARLTIERKEDGDYVLFDFGNGSRHRFHVKSVKPF